MKADKWFMAWLEHYLPNWEDEYSGDLRGLYAAWLAGKHSTNYVVVPSSEAKMFDEFWEPLVKRWLVIEVNAQKIGVQSQDRLVRRRK